MSGRRSRDKGNRAERALVRWLQERGFAAERVPLSGACGGSYTGDVTWPVLGSDRVGEVKVRAKGFSQLYGWLQGNDFLVVRSDRREPLLVIRLPLAAEVAMAAEAGRVATAKERALADMATQTHEHMLVAIAAGDEREQAIAREAQKEKRVA